MALFPNVESSYTFGGKSHPGLVVSEGAAPAEKWIVSKDNQSDKFEYEFGPEGNQTVELAKGKIVELGEPEYDNVTGRMVSTIKQAEVGSKKAVGVLHHNVYEQRRGRFSGNNQPNPVILTRSYVEVPLFEHDDEVTAKDFAKAMHYGAAYAGADNKIQPGDFVKVGEDGNFVKMNLDELEGDSPFQIVGQALAVERELPPAGFLQYYMDMDIPEIEAFLKAQGHAPSPGSNGKDAGAFPYGAPFVSGGWKAAFDKLINPKIDGGIPFLTDGYFRAKETLTNVSVSDIYDAGTNNDGAVEDVRTSGDVTINEGMVSTGEAHNSAIFIKLRHKIDKTESEPVTVKLGGEDVSAKDVHVDLHNNLVVVYLEPNQAAAELTLDVKSVVDPVAGIPTSWDHKGSVGAVRILLQR